ncbi:SusC/RagA family TonB-linked outer membrane protein [Chitinophaga sp. sic0106]|uniref:SusC/RagA family TonB-linked outer membrane protein n=1 Tax=Chitinophaga sp. sic0106 TaxID=2854785 RepID=UPI001C46B62F|nr:SusC/RagA family TonB-linked outer membrane protein [Chitinophaga sp. sic0106]MBV7532555.1 SusC/RagA family TonB-linked outer membrane protein [Chitinophaga sp. sic0106]
MRITAVLLLVATLQVSANAYAQRISLHVRNMALQKVFVQIRQQTGYTFFWNQEQLDQAKPVTVEVKDASLKDVLDQCLQGSSLTFVIKESSKSVFVKAKTTGEKDLVGNPPPETITVRGRISDPEGQPLVGATVMIQGTNRGAAVDASGNYELTGVAPDAVLLFRLVGYEPQTVKVNKRSTINVQLAMAAQKINEVVVTTGIFTRKKESFTGAYSVYTGDQLKTMGNQNIIQSLRSLDPSMLVLENNLAGSNPNVMPNLAIQGKTSLLGQTDALQNDPNQPLFILDGFESDLVTIMGLDINRVASITILKDAASTAIYGSKAANGVVVVETKVPKNGAMGLSFNADYTASMPDLRDYNMMNAAQILEFQRLAGVYTSTDGLYKQAELDSIYNTRLNNVLRGVNTYWMGKPLQSVALAQNYSIYADGGEGKFRYGIGFKYGKIDGVMKGSGRNVGNGNIDLTYRSGKFTFSNKLLISGFKATDSPYGSFEDYVRTIPYYEDNGKKYIDSTKDAAGFYRRVNNPMYQLQVPNSSTSNELQLSNRFGAYYQPTKNIRVEARLALTKRSGESEKLRSPNNTEFDNSPFDQKGTYGHSRTNGFSYEAFLQASYGAVLHDRHEINFVPGFTTQSSTTTGDSYQATGFPQSSIMNPSFATGYPAGGFPTYNKAENRSVSGFMNAHYGYDRRYMVDATIRRDGSSVFGTNRRFTNTWTMSAGWNLHNESWFKKGGMVNYFQVRASIGNPGNQSFGSYNSFTTLTYVQGLMNERGNGLSVSLWGNPYLAWQKTINKTIGADARLFKDRLSFNLNVFHKFTDPLVVSLPNAPSVGYTSQMINLGNMTATGFDLAVRATVVSIPKSRLYWRVNASATKVKSVFGGIGNSLNVLNKENEGSNKGENNNYSQDLSAINQSLYRYYDGASPDDMWAVRSLGIDPATGREVFLSKDGVRTYTYNSADVVKVGNSQPDMQGIIGTSFQYQGFSLSVNMRYTLNAYQLNTALYSKVENVGASMVYRENLDLRALTGRWKRPGDIAEFKAISTVVSAPISSRFIQKESTLSGESISISYDLNGAAWLKHAGLKGLRMTGYLNDIFRLSTIQRERGIDYPYARTLSFSLNASF